MMVVVTAAYIRIVAKVALSIIYAVLDFLESDHIPFGESGMSYGGIIH